jgi:nitrate/nitrite-specific signal transduction histidine kinase
MASRADWDCAVDARAACCMTATAPVHQASGTAGIAGMRERALLIGGRLSIESRPDHGTEVRLSIPVGQEGS